MDIKRVILFLVCLVLFGCGKTNLFSSWRDCEISVDGKYTDWSRAADYYDERAKVVVNLVNDADYLYVCLISRNRAIETKIMESGLTVWFDPDGAQEKVFGIRFPIGLRRMGMSIDDGEKKRDMTRDWQDQEDKGGLIDRQKERLTDNNFNKRLEALEGLQDKLEIVRSNHQDKPPVGKPHDGGMRKNKPVELSLKEAGEFGIEAKVGRENDYFVYELKVPLVKSGKHLYAIGAKKNELIGLGLDAENFSGSMDGQMYHGGGIHGSRGSMFGNPDSLNLWFSVSLSLNE